jgi:hypothetical protein
MGFFPQQTQILAPLVFLVFVTEFFGSRVLIFHLLSRVAACGVVGTMMGVMVMVHWPNGLFLNWSGSSRRGRRISLAWPGDVRRSHGERLRQVVHRLHPHQASVRLTTRR